MTLKLVRFNELLQCRAKFCIHGAQVIALKQERMYSALLILLSNVFDERLKGYGYRLSKSGKHL